MRRRWQAVLIHFAWPVALGLLLAACGPLPWQRATEGGARSRQAVEAADKTDEAVSPQPAPTAADLAPTDSLVLNPLTGLPPADPANLQRRPLAIKISNFPVQGRPHSGLMEADHVYEYFIGAGMTRFLAIYLGQDSPEVGPIRSGRLIDGQLVSLYQGALGMKGADPFVGSVLDERLPKLVFNAAPALCPALCPYTTAYTYGTFGSTADFSALLASRDLNQPATLEGLVFDPAGPSGGQPADSLWLVYNYLNQVGWDFDGPSGRYLRSQDNADAILAPLVDKNTGERVAFDNVVMLFAEHQYLSSTLIEVDLWDSNGRALLFRDGQMHDIDWVVTGPDQLLQLRTESGQPAPLKPGTTWFQIVSMESEWEQTGPASWHIQFH